MNSLNHAELMEAFVQGNRIIGRTRQGQFFPQFEVEVLGVQSDHVTIRSAWGGATNVGADVGWIEYFICNTITPEPKVTFERVGGRTGCWKKVLNPPPSVEKPTQLPPPPPPAKAQESVVQQITSFGTGPIDCVGGQAKPKPNPKPSRFPQVTHVGGLSWLTYRIIAGSWLAAICRRFFGAGAMRQS